MPTKIEKDAITGTETTGHEWDGIKELNTPLPRWWVWVFYATVLFSLGYWILYPSWPTGTGYLPGLLGFTQRQAIVDELAAARAAQAGLRQRIEEAALDDIVADPELLAFAIAGGAATFADNCAPCHGAGGAGARGYPSLADDDWLWGGDLESIFETVRFGIRSGHEEGRQSDMPRFGLDELLTGEEIDDVAEYVLSLSGRASDAAAAERGAVLFADNCAACHGEEGEGNRALGAPRLNDQIWLYGGDKETVVESIARARRGVMPAWVGRLDEVALKMVTVYVHSLGGGE